MDTTRAFFFQNQGTFLDFQKTAGKAPPSSPLVARLNFSRNRQKTSGFLMISGIMKINSLKFALILEGKLNDNP